MAVLNNELPRHLRWHCKVNGTDVGARVCARKFVVVYAGVSFNACPAIHEDLLHLFQHGAVAGKIRQPLPLVAQQLVL